MIIERFVDVWAGLKPEDAYVMTQYAADRTAKMPGALRYRIEINVPDPFTAVDANASTKVVPT